MTSSQIEQVDDNFVQPAATQLDAIATKDEQIKALITSVQDLKQQLASAQQHITANETRFKTLEDCLDVTSQELNATTITGRQMKDELTKQSEEHFKAFEKLLSCSSLGLNEELITNIPAIVTIIQKDEKMNNILEDVTKIKEELAQVLEVIATQQTLEMTTQKFENELTTVKGEIQSCCSEARKAEDSYTQSLTSIRAELRTSQLVSQHEEGKVSRKLTQQIENLKRNLTETEEHFNKKLKCTEGDITEFREEIKKCQEELKVHVVKEENSLPVAALATSGNKVKENLRNFVIIVIFVGVLAVLLSRVLDVEEITAVFKTNCTCQDEMRVLQADLLSNIDSLRYDQGLQIQRLDDTLNAMQLQIESESELIKSLQKNISAVNQTTLSIVNDVKVHYDHEITEISTLVTELSSKVDTLKDDQVLQLQKLTGIEEDLNITRSHDVQDEIKIAELVAELHKNISAVNETTLKFMYDVKAFCGHENTRMRNLIKDWSLKVDVLRNDQVLYSQRLDDIERDINVTKSYNLTEGGLVELVAKLHDNIGAVNKTALDSISELKAQQIHLHYFSGYPQYREELINKTEKPLTDYSSPVIVKISGISRMINYQRWTNNSFNIKGKTITLSFWLFKDDLNHMIIRYFRPTSMKTSTDTLTLMNQLNDSDHHIVRFDSYTTDGLVYYYTLRQLLKVTPTCQYVVYDSLFLSIDSIKEVNEDIAG